MKTTLRWIESHHIKQKNIIHAYTLQTKTPAQSFIIHSYFYSFIHSFSHLIWHCFVYFVLSPHSVPHSVKFFFIFFPPPSDCSVCFFSHYLSLFLFISLYFLFSSLGIVHAILQSILWVVMPNVCSIKSFFRCT